MDCLVPWKSGKIRLPVSWLLCYNPTTSFLIKELKNIIAPRHGISKLELLAQT